MCTEELINWAFAYDGQSYARYLVSLLNDRQSLPTTMPQEHAAFSNGQFLIQMIKQNPLERNEADKTVKNTINRDFIQALHIFVSVPLLLHLRRVHARRAAYRKLMKEHLSIAANKSYFHNDLKPGRIKAEARHVDNLADPLDEVFSNPWKANAEFTNLPPGIAVTTKIRNDLLKARKRG